LTGKLLSDVGGQKGDVEMSIIRTALKRIGPLRRIMLDRRIARGIGGQSDEARILRRLVEGSDTPKTFVEFGFHPAEFNCSGLVSNHTGLLIDGSSFQVADARRVLPPSITIEQRFLTLENLDFIRTAFPALGVLSVDVDGNDYWFLEALLSTAPAIICVEYNASFLHHSITVPYDPAFDRAEKHRSGWYHGASLAALHKLASAHGYGLAEIAAGGGNAFFTRDGTLDPVTAWRSTNLRDNLSGTTAEAQWEVIKDMPYVTV
jgi:hypothetical protein